ncbi:ATP-binding protein [Paenibacillus sp. P26]|nr:ATP-binding protein [Paenibacillus sp. P26]
MTQTIVEYAVTKTDFHLILCNSNRVRKHRLDMLAHFHNRGFTSVLVNFDIPDEVLQARVANSQRSKAIFRTASSFEEVLVRQQEDSHKEEMSAPIEGEAFHLFTVTNNDEVHSVIQEFVSMAKKLSQSDR